MKFSKNVNHNKDAPKFIFFNEKKKNRKIRIIFDIENWLWKSEIRIFQSAPAKRTLICQKKFLLKSAIFHSIKLPFDVEVAENFSNTYYLIYRTRAIITRSRFETALDYKPRIFKVRKVSLYFKPLCSINRGL